MGKSGYKRFKKQEKAKVKLKGKKTILPKGQNVTDTTFKVKKIIVKEQLKEHGEHELLSKKHLNIKELISRLSHHNVSMRQEALAGLQELIVAHGAQLMLPNLSPLLQAAMSLSVDLESDVRRDTIKLLSAVFERVTEEELSPLFPTVVCHLTCAMTHIDPRVRGDSLRLMDAMLATVPSLTAAHTATLLPHFLDLISQRGEGGGGRSLSLHLDGQVTSEKWRGRVIGRLNRLFAVIVDHARREETQTSHNVKWEAEKRVYLNLYFPVGTSLSLTGADQLANLPIQEYANTLMPLLLDTFIEAVPKRDQEDIQTACVVGVEVAALLQSIVQIILHMWNLLRLTSRDNSATGWFRQMWGEQVVTRLVRERFPYTVSTANRRKRKREADQMLAALQVSRDQEPSCSLLNTQLCLLTFLLSHPGDLWTQSIQHIKRSLRNTGSLQPAESSVLCQCLEAVSDQPPSPATPSLLEAVYKCGLLDSDRHAFEFLTKIALLPSHHLHQDKHFMLWLDSLPALLCRPVVAMSTVRSIAHIASHNLPAFSNSLDGWYEEIICNLLALKVTGDQDYEGRRLVVGLVYWVRDWDQEMAQILGRLIKQDSLGSNLTVYLRDILRLKADFTEDEKVRNMLQEIL
uniref:Pre-rRNA-processing protein Ipi1 N-terminal domain-containing protein n=2 Tax=Graphocephala atropunctata TaxID=36148 RepID=A0A1B6L904_9HEMI